MSNYIVFKLNQFPSSLQSQPSSSPPADLFSMILLYTNKWLAAIPNLFHSLVAEFDKISPFKRIVLIVLCLLCFCYLSAIIRCISGLFMKLWSLCKKMFRMCCCCCCFRRSSKMMKAPGTDGELFIPRDYFESDPRSYFANLRANNATHFLV
ncbi:hypothetical protein BVRB_6g136240 [Beta vulgaris subsp. vulgaris]|nr:hypothetical protein BVRB_6g136240 [Beta vulgaris subsp. vulgaris]